MITLEFEENFEVKVYEFRTFREKDEWFKKNPWIWKEIFALYGKEEVE